MASAIHCRRRRCSRWIRKSGSGDDFSGTYTIDFGGESEAT